MNGYFLRLAVQAIVLTTLATSALAAKVAPNDLQKLLEIARRDGAAPVTIYMADISLNRLVKDLPQVKAEMANRAAILIKELGATAWEGGRSISDMGHMDLYLTEAGLQILANSTNAISFRPDKAWEHSSIRDGAKREEIENRLRQTGFVDLDVTWNVDGLQYDVDANANVTLRMTDAQRSEARLMAGRALQKLTRMQGADRAAAEAFISNAIDQPTPLRLDREGLITLIENPEVRHLAPHAYQGKRLPHVDRQAVDEAARSGSATVIISVLDPMPSGKNVSKASDDERIKANQRSIDALLRIAGGGTNVRPMPEFGALAVRLSANGLRTLEASSDSRLLSIEFNRPVAYLTGTTLQQPAAMRGRPLYCSPRP